ncbi:MAG: imelysin family protein [Bacteroidota bacterium]
MNAFISFGQSLIKSFLAVGAFGLLLLLVSCDNGPVDPGDTDDFNRETMLVNWADNIIVPSFTAFQADAEALAAATDAFVQSVSQENLDELRQEWKDAYISWQNVSMFALGKAEAIALRTRINTYPLDKEQVDSNIDGGSWNLELPSNYISQGFPALDYLLYGIGDSDAEILDLYQTGEKASNYRDYLQQVSATIYSLIQDVVIDWNQGYRDSFVQNNGNSATASVDLLINDFLFYYEKHLRAGKVGIPAGVFSSGLLPTHVEAPYKQDFSKELLLQSLDAVQNFFNGVKFGGTETGESLDSYLDYLNSIKDGADLSQLINEQFDAARAKINELPDNFAQQIETDHIPVLQAYDELQKNVVLMKVDMLQALNVNVDYVDADGD